MHVYDIYGLCVFRYAGSHTYVWYLMNAIVQ